MVQLNPYLSFRDNAREALEFYHAALGGDLDLREFAGLPGMGQEPTEDHLILHGQLTTDDGLVLMASDTPSTMPYDKPQGVSVSLSGDDGARLHAAWDALSAGGEITMPLGPAPWGGEFGMFTDRFGIAWMVSVDGA